MISAAPGTATTYDPNPGPGGAGGGRHGPPRCGTVLPGTDWQAQCPAAIAGTGMMMVMTRMAGHRGPPTPAGTLTLTEGRARRPGREADSDSGPVGGARPGGAGRADPGALSMPGPRARPGP